jgi:hypothetical protein
MRFMNSGADILRRKAGRIWSNIYEYEVRSTRIIARRRGRRRTSAKMIVLSRSFLSFPSWPSFLHYEARGKKARGDVAAYTSQPMPLV